MSEKMSYVKYRLIRPFRDLLFHIDGLYWLFKDREHYEKHRELWRLMRYMREARKRIIKPIEKAGKMLIDIEKASRKRR